MQLPPPCYLAHPITPAHHCQADETQQPGQRVLLCDVFHDYLDRNDNLLYREDTLHGIKIGDPEQQWRWSIAPEGELDASYRLQATVSGFSNWS